MKTLEGHVAVVTGGTLGVGRGIASALAQYGALVFVTGRSVQDGAPIDEHITGIRCDHRLDAEVTAAFERVARETHGIEARPVWMKTATLTTEHAEHAEILGEWMLFSPARIC